MSDYFYPLPIAMSCCLLPLGSTWVLTPSESYLGA